MKALIPIAVLVGIGVAGWKMLRRPAEAVEPEPPIPPPVVPPVRPPEPPIPPPVVPPVRPPVRPPVVPPPGDRPPPVRPPVVPPGIIPLPDTFLESTRQHWVRQIRPRQGDQAVLRYLIATNPGMPASEDALSLRTLALEIIRGIVPPPPVVPPVKPPVEPTAVIGVSVIRGQMTTVTGSNWPPGTVITVSSTAFNTTTMTADKKGFAHKRVLIRPTAPFGAHSVTLTGGGYSVSTRTFVTELGIE